ncbi:tRNA (adenosine(37)-N6)-dimethylallyltransferase MiaA [Lagierella sp.]|uniref:tRNA (adenosine(37)-N6)-dimethylallyltransferase MiaA n=1 Tax=Lagierella sp. TaxID=2849657 RepID=UPI002632E39D|nr:tRNA (adenosine(37)-N6)-dimethylallyltransferase MiaA [Lagierella sp.]
MKDVLLIVGPTGVGKTKLSLILANLLQTEIISADSMQIYRGMDIGTAKVSKEMQKKIKHYLIDIVKPDQEYNVSNFQKDAFTIIDQMLQKNKIPIIVGGTGLYINSIVYELNFEKGEPDEEYRDKLWDSYDAKGINPILDKLHQVDPESLKTIDKNNVKRIIRALEYNHTTGKLYSENSKNFRQENIDYNFHIYCLYEDRAKLYDRINCRVDTMISEGLIDEVKTLLMMYDKNNIAFKAIGYKEVIDYLDNEISFEEMLMLLKRNSRRLAKRQYTWFRRDKRIKWIDIEEYDYDFDKIANKIMRDIYE